MKKMLIAMVSAIALMVSIIGCQIYDSQTNVNLYHDGVKLQDIAADFDKECTALKDNSTDTKAFENILDVFYQFDEQFVRKCVMPVVKAIVADKQKAEIGTKTGSEADAIKEKWNEKLEDTDWCIKTYEDEFADINDIYLTIYNSLFEAASKLYPAKTLAETQAEYDAKKALFIENYINKYTGPYTDIEFVVDKEGTTWSINGLWEKTYKLRWDYNSKK